MEVKLSKGKWDEIDLGYGPQVQYRVRTVGLYVVIESAVGVTVIWDRKTTVRVVLDPKHSVSNNIHFRDEEQNLLH